MASPRAGFTLLEICLALMIGSLLMLVAIPSITGLLAERRLRQSYERFDQLVTVARNRSVAEQRTYLLRRDRRLIEVVAADPDGGATTDGPAATWPLEEGENLDLLFPAVLEARLTPGAWTFWKTGQCEPAKVSYHGQNGTWEVGYNALTARGEFLRSSIP